MTDVCTACKSVYPNTSPLLSVCLSLCLSWCARLLFISTLLRRVDNKPDEISPPRLCNGWRALA